MLCPKALCQIVRKKSESFKMRIKPHGNLQQARQIMGAFKPGGFENKVAFEVTLD